MAAKAKTQTETYTIAKRRSWHAAVNVEITCDPTLPPSIKLGLAVRVAYSTDADLRGADLTGADLRGADLRGAVLRGADLRDADLRDADLRDVVLTGAVLTGAVLRGADLRDAVLTGAVLTGAVLRGEKIECIFAIAGRLDGYTFYGVQLRTGAVKIAAGCRWFTPEQFRAHVEREHPGTDKARETLDLIEFIEKRAVGLPAPVAEAPDR
jgi:hypothetical protein